MSDDKSNENNDAAAGAEPENQQHASNQDGPKFTDSPDPLAGLKKTTSDMMDSMEGKTVSMKTYVGTIIGVVVLMLLARCGG